ncbi:hypothetical protein HPB48_002567 [Haemaphysalis longicornis]|uniref:Uncharacterized protein n=1 Tax=Haemaphysalis longicornis TaxID=44386 RepID=A0A9J6GKA0_HAELO|nr:hypothetical protein HPB48_002567 [Haemaphysalis longicornis]
MPMLWGFYVGRHPSGSLKNTIYMTLDSRYNDWIGTVEMLMYKRRVRDYLRHCAEIVGGKGQSYESMIEDVLQAHHELAAVVVAYWDPFSGPRYVDLSDPDLRRAVNGQLPDDSQLWWKNEIVNLQPELFHRLNDTFFSLDEYRKRFTVLFGAYVVWALLPLISSSRTANILADMHSPSRTVIEQRLQCYGLLQEVMPLAKWHIDNEALAEGEATRHLLRLAVLSANKLVTPYGESVRKRAEITNSLLSLNALNMSETWEELDKAYDYLPNESSKDFFKLFLSASRATITMFKRSLRRPRNTIFHVPGIASDWLYRLLVVREVILPNSLASPPLVMPWHPAAVRVALAGTFISYQILIFMLFKFFYNDHFEVSATPAKIVQEQRWCEEQRRNETV